MPMLNRRTFLKSLPAVVGGVLAAAKAIEAAPSYPHVVSVSDTCKTIRTGGFRPADALKRGDVIMFDGVYSLNPRGYDTRVPKQFVVTADVQSDGIVHVSPPIITQGMYRNASGVLKRRARIMPVGAPVREYSGRAILARQRSDEAMLRESARRLAESIDAECFQRIYEQYDLKFLNGTQWP